ncbi:hypothetical protein ACFQE8_22555 [Salinirubellus sp. GCM10025818]|uniref:hypothetical protein n=1 Tax=Salinirubellus TaxID=2162630 RepID=UPI0030D11DD7
MAVTLNSPAGESIASADPIPDPDVVKVLDIELAFGDSAPVTEGNDLLNSMLIKSTASAATEPGTIRSVEDAPTQPLMPNLQTPREGSDPDGILDAAANFVESDQYVEKINAVLFSLSDLFDGTGCGVRPLPIGGPSDGA